MPLDLPRVTVAAWRGERTQRVCSSLQHVETKSQNAAAMCAWSVVEVAGAPSRARPFATSSLLRRLRRSSSPSAASLSRSASIVSAVCDVVVAVCDFVSAACDIVFARCHVGVRRNRSHWRTLRRRCRCPRGYRVRAGPEPRRRQQRRESVRSERRAGRGRRHAARGAALRQRERVRLKDDVAPLSHESLPPFAPGASSRA